MQLREFLLTPVLLVKRQFDQRFDTTPIDHTEGNVMWGFRAGTNEHRPYFRLDFGKRSLRYTPKKK